MNKRDLIEEVAGQIETTHAQAERIVGVVLDGIQAGVKKDGSVQLVGFGSFTLKKRAARTGRNPQTGEAIKIKPSKTVTFRAGKQLKDSL